MSSKIVIDPNFTSPTPTSKITVRIDDEIYTGSLDNNQTILENLQGLDIPAPFSCMAGVCLACLGKVNSGKVVMDEEHTLTSSNLANDEALVCSAKALSEELDITFS